MQTIKLDISQKNNVPLLCVKQRDVGHRFAIELYENGVPYTVDENNTFAVWYSGASGEGNYTEIGDETACIAEGNKIIVQMIMQMIQNPGDHEMCVVMYGQDNEQKGFWNVPYYVEEIPGMDSQVAEQYYDAFVQAQKKAEEAAEQADASMSIAVGAAEQAESASERAEAAADRAEEAASETANKKPKDFIVTATFDTVVSETISTGTASAWAYNIATAISQGATAILIDNEARVYEYDGYKLEPNYNNAFFKAQEFSANGLTTYSVAINNEGQASRVKNTMEYAGGGSVDGAVTYTPQTLTEEQKAQARENIGAVDENQVLTLIQENLPPNGDEVSY